MCRRISILYKLLGIGVVSIWVGIVALACVGCDQTSTTTTTTPSKVEKTEPPPPKEKPEEKATAEKPEAVYRYDPTDRREPFKTLIVEQIQKAVDAIVTPSPEEITSPLQKFDLGQLKLTGIILGGLGDYARVIAPDGKSYTINVGTLMGTHLGKVISISDNVILVKETIRYESGKVEEVETPIYLNPIKEEGKKP